MLNHVNDFTVQNLPLIIKTSLDVMEILLYNVIFYPFKLLRGHGEDSKTLLPMQRRRVGGQFPIVEQGTFGLDYLY